MKVVGQHRPASGTHGRPTPEQRRRPRGGRIQPQRRKHATHLARVHQRSGSGQVGLGHPGPPDWPAPAAPTGRRPGRRRSDTRRRGTGGVGLEPVVPQYDVGTAANVEDREGSRLVERAQAKVGRKVASSWALRTVRLKHHRWTRRRRLRPGRWLAGCKRLCHKGRVGSRIDQTQHTKSCLTNPESSIYPRQRSGRGGRNSGYEGGERGDGEEVL